MNYLYKPFWLVLLISSFLVACSESADNPAGTKDGPVKGEVRPIGDLSINKDGRFILDGTLLNGDFFSPPGELTGFGSAEVAKLQAENLQKPILYGIGGGGVSIDNTFEESKTLLTPPEFGPISDGRTWYNEQIMVSWKLDGSRKPRFVAFLSGYKGTLDAGSFGQIGMQTKWLSYKGGNPEEGAKKLIVELHRELEQVPDPNYNCLESTKYKRCTLDYGGDGQTNFVMIFPGIQILVAKSEFQIGIMLVPRNSEPGLLANRFDVLSGSILVPKKDPFLLGSTKKEIFDRLIADQGKTDPEVFVGTAGFGYLWEGVYLDFHRTNYVNTQKVAEDDNISTVIQVMSTFPDYLTFDGKRILMTQSKGKVSFALEESVDPVTGVLDVIHIDADVAEYKLKMTTPIYKENSKIFSDQFAEFISAELKDTYDVVEYRSFGYQDEEKVTKSISTSIRAYNLKDYNGISVGFSVNERQTRLGFVNVSLIDTDLIPFNSLIFPASAKALVRIDGEQELKDSNGDTIPDLSTAKPFIDPAFCQEVQHPGTGEMVMVDPSTGTLVEDPSTCKTLPNLLTCEKLVDPVSGEIVINEETGEPELNMDTCDPLLDFSTAKPKTFVGKLPYFTTLAGMKLNDAIVLTDVDALGRGEATAQYFTEDGSLSLPERSSFTEQGNFSIPDISFTKERQQSFVGVGTGTVLGLKMIGSTADGQIGRVVSISSNNIYSTIEDLCSFGSRVSLKIGMTEAEVENALSAAAESTGDCNYFKVEDNGGLGYLSEIYFPDENIKLEFSNRALTAATIYLPMAEVDTTLPEVAK